MDKTDTAEYRAFQGCFDRLVTGVGHDVESVATKAFAKNLISQENQRNATNQHHNESLRTNDLLGQILTKVEQNPACFDTFMAILEEIPSLKELAREMTFKRSKQTGFNLCKPGKPIASDVTQNSITIEWEKPKFGSENVEAYLVQYRCADNSTKSWKSKLTDNNTDSKISITDLSPQTKYIFKVQPDLEDGSAGAWSEVSDPIETKAPPIHPNKPTANIVTHDSITLRWEKPEHGSENVESYRVRYRSADDQDQPNWKREMTSSNETELTITDLSPQTKYIFKIRPGLEDGGVGIESEVIVTTEPPPLAVCLSREAQARRSLLIDGPPTFYQLPGVTYTVKDKVKMIAKCHFGDPELGKKKQERVLMLVGATGEGKSTLIECMVNYILGVKWEYDFRFKLIKEEARSQAESQTRFITAYTFYPLERSALDYTLTIIDTPGYGDTRGIQQDAVLTEQIKQFFSTPPPHGIDHIDGVGFVTKAASSRLTPTQQYIFDSILGVFGIDMKDNIFLMVTFCDAQQPQVLEAIRIVNIPYADYFKFNNSALYANNSDTTDIISSGFWKMVSNSLKNFFTNFEKMQPRSLLLTNNVLDERKQLETLVEGLQRQITYSLDLIRELERDKKAIVCQLSEDNNEPFTYEVEVMKGFMEPVPDKKNATICLNCKHTCHYPCTIKNDSKRYNCFAMEGSYWSRNKDSCCGVCPRKCHWTQHVNRPYRYEQRPVKEKKTLEDLIKKYSTPTAMPSRVQQSTAEDILSGVAKHLKETYGKVLELIKRAQESINKLDQIALRKSDSSRESSSQVAYIELLIEAEKQGEKPGHEERVEALKVLRERAQVAVEVAKSMHSGTMYVLS